MKNIKKLKEVINQFHFLELLNTDLNEYQVLRGCKYNTVILVGIGGSSLGAKLLADLNQSNKKFHAIDHINSEVITNLLSNLDLSDTIFIIQSKSGNTLETLSTYNIIKKTYFDYQFKSNNTIVIGNHFIFCTGVGTTLDLESKSLKSRVFYLNEKVGGRFSVLSCMGFVVATLLDIPIPVILESAKKYAIDSNIASDTQNSSDHTFKTNTVIRKISNNIGESLGINYIKTPLSPNNCIEDIVRIIIDSEVRTIVLLNYNHHLNLLGDWLVQLVSESLGKDKKEFILFSFKGVADQHSSLQMLEDGIRNKFIFAIPPTFGPDIAVPNTNITLNQQLKAEYKGTLDSLNKIHKIHQFDESVNIYQYLGQIIIFFEIFVAYLGIANDINPFDQPGVEKSKQLTKKYLRL